MSDIVDRLTGEKCDYDTRCYAASEIAILRLEKQKLREEVERLRAALMFGRGAARLAIAKASSSGLSDFAVAALEAIETNADAALEGAND
jgi:hypothetical protein